MAKPGNILEPHASHIQTVLDFGWQLIPSKMSNAVYCETAIGTIRICFTDVKAFKGVA